MDRLSSALSRSGRLSRSTSSGPSRRISTGEMSDMSLPSGGPLTRRGPCWLPLSGLLLNERGAQHGELAVAHAVRGQEPAATAVPLAELAEERGHRAGVGRPRSLDL